MFAWEVLIILFIVFVPWERPINRFFEWLDED